MSAKRALASWRGGRGVARGSWGALGALLVLLSACTGPSQRAQPGTQPPGTFAELREVPIGLCEDYPPESTQPATLVRDFELLKRLDTQVLRVSFGWDDLEPSPGDYRWSIVDDFVKLAVDRYGLELIAYVCYTPEWAAIEPGSNAWKSPPRDPAAYGRLMQGLAERYRGKIRNWEIWNEPDNRDYLVGTVAQFAELLEQGAAGVRRGNPEARVVLGGIADNLEFLAELFERHAGARHVDVVNVHRYPETWTGQRLEDLVPFLERARGIVESAGEGEPIWLAEVGYSSYRKGGYVSDYFNAVYDYEHTPRFQAVALQRILTLALASGIPELIAWYEISDLPPVGDVIGDVNNRHLGVLTPEGQPKPALGAFRTLASAFDRPFRVLRGEVRATVGTAADVELRAFQFDDGKILAFTWLRTVTDARAALPAGSADPRRAQIDIILPVAAGAVRQARVLDDQGIPLGTRPVVDRGGTLHVLGLELPPGSIRLVELER